MRFSRATLDRLVDASALHVIEQAAIVRRAIRRALRLGEFDNVEKSENSETTTYGGDAMEIALEPDLPDLGEDEEAGSKIRAAVDRYLDEKGA